MDVFDVLVRIVPLALLAALSPFNISVVILMLLSKDHPIARSVAFVGGFIAGLILVGSLAYTVLSSIYIPPMRPGVYVIIATLGALALVVGARQFFLRIDPDQPPAEWMQRISTFRPVTAFVAGFTMSTLGLKTLTIYVTCLGIIGTSGVPQGAEVLLYVVLILLMTWTLLVPILIFLLRPDRSKDILQRMRQWLTQHQHTIAGLGLIVAGLILLLVGYLGIYAAQVTT
jgi:hypothetical protein